jgi:hypothetical protein
MNYAVSTSTTTQGLHHISTSEVNSAGIDGAGNVYLMVRTFGKCLLGNMSIGEWDNYNEYGPNTSGVIKFDNALQPLRKTELETCVYYCTFYKDLLVRQNGECFYFSTFGYGQSGNDVMQSAIHKLDQAGAVSATYSLFPQEKSLVADIVMDDCENVYFTGHYRDGYNTNNPVCHDLVAGRLSPSLNQDWVFNFRDCSNYLYGTGIAFAGGDACVVTGTFEDSLEFGSPALTHAAQGSFITGIHGPNSSPCVKLTTALSEKNAVKTGMTLSPNPASEKVRVRVGFHVSRISIYDLTGQLVRSADDEVIDVKGLHPGVYFVQVLGEADEKSTGKLVIER